MNKVLLVDCNSKLNDQITGLLGDTSSTESEDFSEQRQIDEFTMIILGASDNPKDDLVKTKKLRYQTKFRDIPIILLSSNGELSRDRNYIMAGATEVLSLPQSSPTACRQIFQGYLTPNRKPLEKEMEYIRPFVDHTENVLSTMASLETKFRDVYFQREIRIFGDVSGVIGLSGNAEGTVVITFYWDLARKAISSMLGIEEDEIDAVAIHDGVGELINMISGSAKADFTNTPFHFQLSLPTVVVGSGHEIGHPEHASIAVLVFDVNDKAFAVQLSLKPREASDANE
jgi:chemotaxis protein CheX